MSQNWSHWKGPPQYWFRELYLGLKVTASFDRSESYTRIIDGQVRCITPDFKPKDLQVAWNVQFITVFVPAWMIPPIYHSLRRESIKNTNSASAIGVKSVRPTWFEDIVTTKEPASHAEQEQHEPMHGLKLVVKEEALPLREQPEFPALAELAKRGLLAPDTWNCKRAQISLKASIDAPMRADSERAPVGCWCSFIISHISSCFTVRFTFLSPLSLRHGFVVVCFEVTICELLCLDGWRHVISGILAGGIPGFRMVLCCFAHLLVWSCDFDVLLFVSAAIPCLDDTMLSLLH